MFILTITRCLDNACPEVVEGLDMTYANFHTYDILFKYENKYPEGQLLRARDPSQ